MKSVTDKVILNSRNLEYSSGISNWQTILKIKVSRVQPNFHLNVCIL